jgi:hypothetical protein
VLKIGTELEFSLPRGTQTDPFREHLTHRLKPSRDFAHLGELGILDVVKDHCGVELQIIGRHPYWYSLLHQYQQIIKILLDEQIRMRQTCGLHFHLIAIGLSEPIPQIVLANLWNLVRRHAPGLKYLFSGGDLPHGICRRRQHNAHQEMVSITPVFQEMNQIQRRLRNSLVVPEHHNFFNLEHVVFNDAGEVKTFHLEMRFPDGDMTPTSIVAKTFLFLALVLKSVEISKYGLIHSGKKKDWERKKQLLDLLSNNEGELARSDTSGIKAAERQELTANAMDLLHFLKSIFNKFSNPAYAVLTHLAQNPISQYRIEKKNWQEIEQILQGFASYPTFLDETDHHIIKIIELGLDRKKNSVEAWLSSVAATVGIPKNELKSRIDRFLERYPKWDAEIGSYVFSR